MLSAILILLVMPFTDLGRSRGLQFRPLSKLAFYVFVANFLILMQLGAKHVESPFIEFGQISTVLYFSHFLIILPLVSLLENSLIELRTTATKKVTITYLYQSLLQGNRNGALYGGMFTIIFAAVFTGCLVLKYSVSSFTISDCAFGS